MIFVIYVVFILRDCVYRNKVSNIIVRFFLLVDGGKKLKWIKFVLMGDGDVRMV